MGFTTGFLSGMTFTTLSLYLTLAHHRQQRQDQSLAIRQSLLSILDTTDPEAAKHIASTPYSSARYRLHYQNEPGIAERFKSRWNTELVSGLHRVQAIDWTRVYNRLEDGVADTWGALMQKTREGVTNMEDQAKKIDLGKVEKSVERVGRRVREELRQERITDRRREGF